jgi:hypothetical protein
MTPPTSRPLRNGPEDDWKPAVKTLLERRFSPPVANFGEWPGTAAGERRSLLLIADNGGTQSIYAAASGVRNGAESLFCPPAAGERFCAHVWSSTRVRRRRLRPGRGDGSSRRRVRGGSAAGPRRVGGLRSDTPGAIRRGRRARFGHPLRVFRVRALGKMVGGSVRGRDVGRRDRAFRGAVRFRPAGGGLARVLGGATCRRRAPLSTPGSSSPRRSAGVAAASSR